MNRRLVILLAALVAAAVAPARALADNSRAVHYYVSLGDSLAEGFQPNGDGDHGYADQLYALMKVDDPTLRLVKLGCGGETTLSTVDPYLPWEGRGATYHCNYPHGSQLAEAVSFLHAHAGFIRAVTIDIGGNDFLDFGERAPDVIRANLTQIVDEGDRADLRRGAPASVPRRRLHAAVHRPAAIQLPAGLRRADPLPAPGDGSALAVRRERRRRHLPAHPLRGEKR
jgi:GDSL-like Lipase/Acylhydrolase family